MRSAFTAGARLFVLGFAVVIFMTLNQGVARAETVTVNGITLGAFNTTIFNSNTPTLFGLTFNGAGFPNPIAIVDTSTSTFSVLGPSINLGSFTLTGDPATYTGNTFSLALTFSFLTPSIPVNLIGSSQPSFTAVLSGVIQNSTGSLTVDFNNAPSVFTVFVDGNAIGTFSVIVDDLIIQPGQSANVVGTISQTSEVPEPATLLMLSMGLAGVSTAVRKRWKS